MPDIVVRPYEDRDEEGYFSVRSLTYNDGLPIPQEYRTDGIHTRFVAESDGQIAGIFSILDLKLTRGPATFPGAGVAAVGVSPDLRRGGVGVEMMRWSIARFKETGLPLAALYAYREPFYAKSGYVTCGKRIKITVPVHRLPKIESRLPIRRLTPSDWKELHPCFSQFAHARSGTNIRSEPMWQRVLAEGKSLTIYAAGDPVEGYVAVSHSVAFWEEQSISELVWSTEAGYDACIAIIHRIGINKTALTWFEPSDSPYYTRHLDQGVTTELVRPAMFRVCDVKKCLEGLKPQASGGFTIFIDDRQVIENCGPWEVTFEPNAVHVQKSQSEKTDIDMGIQEFTQAFLGEPSLADLVRIGRVKVHSAMGSEAANRLLPFSPVYLSDFF